MTDFSNSEDPHAEAVDELSRALEAEYPDPVDLFKDALAARLGFVRHPSCPLEEWRRQRARLIDAAEGGGLLASLRWPAVYLSCPPLRVVTNLPSKKYLGCYPERGKPVAGELGIVRQQNEPHRAAGKRPFTSRRSLMGRLTRWMMAKGAPGSTARWAVKNYKQLAASYPDLSHPGILHTMISNRYAVLPNESQEIVVRSLIKDSFGLGNVVVAILTAEAGLMEKASSVRSEIFEVVDEELEKSGLPHEVCEGPQ